MKISPQRSLIPDSQLHLVKEGLLHLYGKSEEAKVTLDDIKIKIMHTEKHACTCLGEGFSESEQARFIDEFKSELRDLRLQLP